MKTTSKIILGAVATVAVSAGVAGVTTYSLIKPQEYKNTSFTSEFDTAEN